MLFLDRNRLEFGWWRMAVGWEECGFRGDGDLDELDKRGLNCVEGEEVCSYFLLGK